MRAYLLQASFARIAKMQRAFAEMNLHTSMVVNEDYMTPVVEFQAAIKLVSFFPLDLSI